MASAELPLWKPEGELTSLADNAVPVCGTCKGDCSLRKLEYKQKGETLDAKVVSDAFVAKLKEAAQKHAQSRPESLNVEAVEKKV